MRLEIRIYNDAEEVVAEYKGDPCQPGQWRATTGNAIKGNMPKQSDNGNTGTYDLAGFTYQPHVRVERPNGYSSPQPSPSNGQQSAPLPGWRPMENKFPAKSLWGPISPTASPAPSATTSNSLGVPNEHR